MMVKSSTVSPSLFVQAMDQHWTNTLKNAPSEALHLVWAQMAKAFNHQVDMNTAGSHVVQDGKWQVLQPPTGTGKSQGLSVFASMLDYETHPGILIVVRQICQADELAKTMNDLAGTQIAVARHSESKVEPETLAQIPVVIITHSAYLIGLDAISRGEVDINSAWNLFHRFRDEHRKLVVIDESLDVIEEARVDYNEIQILRAVLPAEAQEDIPHAVAALDKFIAIQTKVSLDLCNGREAKIPDDLLDGLRAEDFTPLRAYLRKLPIYRLLLGKRDRKQNGKQVKRFDELLKSIQAVVSQWRWYAKKGKIHLITTARFLMSDVDCGAVILDATADANTMYGLFGKDAHIHSLPAQARTYQNVTLHVSTGHKVGKGAMIGSGLKVSKEIFAALKTQLPYDRKVFVCCHKDVRPHMEAYGDSFREVAVANWGAVDGRNDWADFDTAVIAGLPYRDLVTIPNSYMAFKGEQDADFFGSDELKNIRRDMEIGHLVISVIQAVNRVRCRRVIDEHGNCKPTDVFILLPKGGMADSILSGICKQMPGVQIKDWDYSATKSRKAPRRSRHNEVLLAFAEAMPAGRISFSDIRTTLGFSQDTVKRLQQRIRVAKSELKAGLKALGVLYEVTGQGRGRRAYLVKEVTA